MGKISAQSDLLWPRGRVHNSESSWNPVKTLYLEKEKFSQKSARITLFSFSRRVEWRIIFDSRTFPSRLDWFGGKFSSFSAPTTPKIRFEVRKSKKYMTRCSLTRWIRIWQPQLSTTLWWKVIELLLVNCRSKKAGTWWSFSSFWLGKLCLRTLGVGYSWSPSKTESNEL